MGSCRFDLCLFQSFPYFSILFFVNIRSRFPVGLSIHTLSRSDQKNNLIWIRFCFVWEWLYEGILMRWKIVQVFYKSPTVSTCMMVCSNIKTKQCQSLSFLISLFLWQLWFKSANRYMSFLRLHNAITVTCLEYRHCEEIQYQTGICYWLKSTAGGAETFAM